MIWDSIIDMIFTYWDSFILEKYEIELIIIGNKYGVVVKKELENKLDTTREVIKFLNSQTKQELRQLGVNDRKQLVVDDTRVITMHSLMEKAYKLLKQVNKGATQFKELFNNVISQGMLVPWDGNGDLYPSNAYKDILKRVKDDDSRVACVETSLSKQGIVDLLSKEFDFLLTFKMISKDFHPSIYEKYTYLESTLISMRGYFSPMDKQWENIAE